MQTPAHAPETHAGYSPADESAMDLSKPLAPRPRPLPIMVFFYSNTCGLSRRMDSLVDHFLRTHREHLKLAKVDIDERPDLAHRLAVTETPALILMENLLEVARLEGRHTLPDIRTAFEDHLDLNADESQPVFAHLASAS